MEFGHLEGEEPYLGDLLNLLSKVINHLLTGMILQVVELAKKPTVYVGTSGRMFQNPEFAHRKYQFPFRPTLPETNIAPETLGLEDEFPFGARPPARCYVSFWERNK